jgi:hypothetical protein
MKISGWIGDNKGPLKETNAGWDMMHFIPLQESQIG